MNKLKIECVNIDDITPYKMNCKTPDRADQEKH